MSETVIRICEDGKITVERDLEGIKSFKQIAPDTLIQCINKSLLRGAVHSGLLPKNCISFSAYDDGCKSISMVHSENMADISYFGTEYKNFPLPRLVFGFKLTAEGRVSSCKLGVVENTENLKLDTKMYYYPLSNVSGFHLCTGNNALPKCTSLHTLSSLPYYIISMPNNNDYFRNSYNKLNLEMRDLLELLKDKKSSYYYSDILIPNGAVLNDFIMKG
ncbi:MAG: hypothetical protein HDT48_02045 [Ruminococcaceae bacterium]|nr:hypothetical protein [Oscillospiraceae bacterium]